MGPGVAALAPRRPGRRHDQPWRDGDGERHCPGRSGAIARWREQPGKMTSASGPLSGPVGRSGKKCQTACKPGSVRAVADAGRPFLWDARCRAPRATNPGDGAEMPLRHGRGFPPPLAGRPYSVLLPVGFALPPLSPGARCALTAPFHPCPRGEPPRRRPCAGGLFSVALSLGSPPPAVSRHRIPVEPGLSSTDAQTPAAAVRPSGAAGMRPAPPGVNGSRRGRDL